jgi:hypothetical protein
MPLLTNTARCLKVGLTLVLAPTLLSAPVLSQGYGGPAPTDRYDSNEVYRPRDPYRSAAPRNDAYVPPPGQQSGFPAAADQGQGYGGAAQGYGGQQPPPPYGGSGGAPYGGSGQYAGQQPYGGSQTYGGAPPPPPGGGSSYGGPQYGQPYDAPRAEAYDPPPPPPGRYADERGSYSRNEILDTGHKFFGSVSQGLASAVEYAFQQAGRPNGYILGEDAGGAVIAGLRYGEGTLYTKDAGTHRIYWQGPSLGYDMGAEGSKTMVLVYNLRDPSEIYQRFGGVQGSAYFVGGVGLQFQKAGDVVLAPIRSGIGLRLGANVGYLKYTRSPTWNPF